MIASKQINKINITIIILLTSSSIFSQSYYIEGYVKSKSGNSLSGATIFSAKSNKGVITNEQGYFRLNLEKGKHTIKISYVGYEPLEYSFRLEENIKRVFLLQHSTLQNIIIKGTKQKIHFNSVQKPMEIDMVTIGAIPSIIGEPDVIKALTLLPGICLTSETSSNLTVRGANHDQNLIILDEAPLYQTGHLFGFVSPFNYPAIKDIKIYKNMIPAIYGGKLSSVIELHSKNGNPDSLTGTYNYGLLNAGFSISAPIIKNKISLFFAGRTFYLGVITLPFYYSYRNGSYSSFGTYYLYDINTNLKYTPSPKEEYSIYLFSGVDKTVALSYQDLSLERENKSFLSWGNHTLSFKYKRKLNNNTFLKNHLTLSKSFNKTSSAYIDNINKRENYEKSRISSLNKTSIKSYIESFKGIHYIKYGFETNYNTIKPFEDKRTGKITSNLTNKYNYGQVDIFADDMVDLGKWSIYLGLRFSNYFTKDKHEWNIEPRLSLNYKINTSNSVGLGYHRLSQYTFLMPVSNLGLPNDIWVSVIDDMSPSIIDQIFLEYNTDFFNELISIETNIFYRKYSNLYDIKNKTSFLFTIPIDWQKHISDDGIAYSYGFEMQTNINLKNIKGILSYTYSRNKYKFDDLNKGKWFPGYYDFPHQLDINITGKMSRSWTYSALFSFKSGKPVTLPKEVLEKSILSNIIIYGDKNAGRLGAYHKLDLSVSKTWKSKKGRTKSITFSLYNAYYHKNPFYYDYIRQKKVRNDGTHRYDYIDIQPRIENISFIPIIPSINYSVKF